MTFSQQAAGANPTDRGASMVEYAFLVILIAIIAFTAVQIIGTEVSTSFSSAADGFTPTN